eukprot:gb/GECH01010527.1/.p1 GENE.gb/GECH01010527.1/~~gb/GECH01010527.1/.p1  ORF type:complete len:1763 (+),score=293.08 gb/GECH01010527.1/:1-5289(+)
MSNHNDQPSANILLPEVIKTELEENNEEKRLKESIFSLLEKGISQKRWDTLILCTKEHSRLKALGFWFSHDEKRQLIPKLYELITRESVDPKARLELVRMLHSLLKKKNTPELDLALDWKPIFNLAKSLLFKTDFEALNLKAIQKNLAKSVSELLPKLAIHLSPDATEALLEQARAYLCPFSHECIVGMLILSHLIPAHNYEEPPVWFEEFLAMWKWQKMILSWNYSFLHVFARLSYESPFCISWGEHMETVYTHILDVIYPENGASSGVKITGSQLFLRRENLLNVSLNEAASWIVYTLTPMDSRPMQFFQKLFHSVESFLHPSSISPASRPASHFIQGVASGLARRVCKERYKPDKWPIIPNDHRVTDSMISEFVELVLPGILPAIYAKDKYVSTPAIQTCKHLAFLHPSYVVPQIMDRAAYALETLTEPHQMFSMLSLLRNIWLAIASNIDRIPDSYVYITQILELAVPGIDINDPFKASLALGLCNTIFTTITLYLPSAEDAATEPPPFSRELIEEWLAEVLQKVFAIVEHVDISQKDDLDKNSGLLFRFFDLCLTQLSSDLYQFALSKIFHFVQSQIGTKGMKLLGNMVTATCRAHPDRSCAMFFDMAYDNLIDNTANQDEFQQLTTNEIIANLYIITKTFICCGPCILHFKQRIIQVLRAAWNSTERKVVKFAGKMIKTLLRTLSTYYVQEHSSLPPEVRESEEFQRSPWRFWGYFTDYEHVDIQWHIPTQEEKDFALELVNKFSKQPSETLNDCITRFNQNQQVATETVQFALLKLQYIYRGASLLIPDGGAAPSTSPGHRASDQETSDEDQSLEEQYDERLLYRVPVTIGLSPVSPDQLSVTREDLLLILHRLCESILENQEDRPKLLKKMIKLLFVVLCYRGRNRSFPGDLRKAFESLKTPLLRSYHAPYLMPRTLIVLRAQEQLYRRIIKSTTHLPYTDVHQNIVHDLFRLATFSYCSVRRQSQYTLRSVLKRFPSFVARDVYTRTFSVLSSPTSAEQLKGANHLLMSDYAMDKILRDWRMVGSFFPSLCNSLLFDDEENHASTFGLVSKIQKAFYILPLEYPFFEGNNNQRKSNNMAKYNTMLHDMVAFSHRIQTAGAMLARNAVVASLCVLIRPDVPCPQDMASLLLDYLVQERSPMHFQVLHATINLLHTCLPQRQHHRLVLLQELYSYTTAEERSRGIEDQEGNPIYLDHRCLGWSKLPSEYPAPLLQGGHTHIHTNDDNGNEEEEDPLHRLLRDYITPDYIRNLLSILVDTRKHTSFIMLLFKYITRIFGHAIVEIVTPPLQEILDHAGSGNADEISYMRVACGVVSGILRGCKYWEISLAEQTQKHFLDTIARPMMTSSSECTDVWVNALHRICHNRDPRRLRIIKNWALDHVELEQGTAATQSRSLQYLYAIAMSLHWTDAAFQRQCVHAVRSSLSHPYGQVRHFISLILASALKSNWTAARDSKTGDIIQGPDNLDDVLLEFISNNNNHLKKLLQDADDIPSSGGTTKSPEERTLKNFVEVFLGMVSNILQHSQAGHLYVIHCLPMLSAVVESTHEEVTNAMPNIVAKLSSLQIPSNHFITLLNFIKNITTGKSWRLRSALVKTLEIILFRQQFNFLNQSQMVKDWMLDLLQDQQVEVRRAAAPALASYLKISDSSIISEFRTIFEKWAKLKKEKNKLKKHAGVLGLGSIVLAHPYDIPSFMPDVLVRLAQHVDDGEPIKTTVHSTFSEFWKSHQDTWHIDKEKFTSEQLHKLTELIVSPTYYA